MKASTLDWISKFLRYTLLTGAILYIGAYFFLAFFRIQYPFALEWLEGGLVNHVSRILSGQKLYVSPSLEFVPFGYTPLYFYLSAVMANIVGIGFMPLRLVSFISSLGCFFIIFLMVKQETGSKFSGILASGLFAATFQISGAWFDVGRIDSLFLFFLLAAVYLIKFGSSSRSDVLAGVCISLSFLTKQTALAISLPIMLYCILLNWRRSIFFIGTIVTIIGVSTILLNYIHGGWYSYYVFDLPKQRWIGSIVKSKFIEFWIRDMFPLSIAFSMSIFYIFAQALNSSKKNFLFYFLVAAGMLGGAWFSRVESGGYNNLLFPAYAVIAILFGLATHTVFEFLQLASTDKQKLMEIYIYLVCIIQFASLIYNPFHQIPTQGDLDVGRKFINTMSQIKGDILIPYHAYLVTLAGKSSYAHGWAVSNIWTSYQGQVRAELINEIRQAIREKRFSAIIIDSKWFRKDIEKYYIKQRSVFNIKTDFWPIPRMKTIPDEFIYVPKSDDT